MNNEPQRTPLCMEDFLDQEETHYDNETLEVLSNSQTNKSAQRSWWGRIISIEKAGDNVNNAMNETNDGTYHYTRIKARSIFHEPLSFSQKIAMLSNLSTSYNITSISLVLPILSQLYPETVSARTIEIESMLASALLFGMIVGQLAGGALGDMFGRQTAMCFVILLQVSGSLGCFWISSNSDDPGLSIRENLIYWRLLLGIGAGGVYPLAATLSAEQSDKGGNNNGDTCNEERLKESESIENKIFKTKLIALTFSTQGIGFLLVPITTWVVVTSLSEYPELTWKIILGLGSVPGFIILIAMIRYFYSTMKERYANANNSGGENDNLESPSLFNPEYYKDHDHESEQIIFSSQRIDKSGEECNHNNSSKLMYPSYAGSHDINATNQNDDKSIMEAIKSEPKLFTKLLGTAFTWFLFDVLFYGNTLFQPLVTGAVFGSSTESDHIIQELARNNAILIILALPGYFFSIVKLNTQSPRYIQSQGFLFMFILYFLIGFNWDRLTPYPYILLILYGGTFFFANYGPNTTTFMLPSTTFTQTQSRATLNGIAAASGKLGALVGAMVFKPLVEIYGASTVMTICGVVSIGGFILTRLFLEE